MYKIKLYTYHKFGYIWAFLMPNCPSVNIIFSMLFHMGVIKKKYKVAYKFITFLALAGVAAKFSRALLMLFHLYYVI